MILHHRLEGPPDAPVVVLGSSLGTTLAMWDPQAEALASSLRVLRYDRRGHGGSPVQPRPTTVAELGGDVLALLDELAFERVSFCGLSLGGVEGMWLATHAPERLNRLALCCTAPSFPPRQGWLDRAATVRAGGMGVIAEAVLGRWFTSPFHAEHPEVVARFRGMLESTPVEGYAACCEALADADLWPALRRNAAPTLVLTGDQDPVVPPDSGDALAAAMPGARHEVVGDAAHLANVEQPERVAAALLRHFTPSEEAA